MRLTLAIKSFTRIYDVYIVDDLSINLSTTHQTIMNFSTKNLVTFLLIFFFVVGKLISVT